MIEYKIEIGSPSDIQRKLNQWRHGYFVHIESTNIVIPDQSNPVIMMVISREPKGK
jgi:hypothetical protein